MLLHTTVWLVIYVAWFFSTRQFHPTLALALSATAVLVTASAVAVYINSLVFLPQYGRRGLWGTYAAALAATVLLLDLAAVLLIQFIYDLLWGPDPARFGFWFNMASDGFIIALHVVAAMAATWGAGVFRGRSSQSP